MELHQQSPISQTNTYTTNLPQIDTAMTEKDTKEIKKIRLILLGELFFAAFLLPLATRILLSLQSDIYYMVDSELVWTTCFLLLLPFYIALINKNDSFKGRTGLFLLSTFISYIALIILAGGGMEGFALLLIPPISLVLFFVMGITHALEKSNRLILRNILLSVIFFSPIVTITMFWKEDALKDAYIALLTSLILFSFYFFYRKVEHERKYSKNIIPFFIVIMVCGLFLGQSVNNEIKVQESKREERITERQAKALFNSNQCETLEAEYPPLGEFNYHQCYFKRAKITNNVNDCKSDYRHDDCIIGIMLRLHDVSLCELIIDKEKYRPNADHGLLCQHQSY